MFVCVAPVSYGVYQWSLSWMFVWLCVWLWFDVCVWHKCGTMCITLITITCVCVAVCVTLVWCLFLCGMMCTTLWSLSLMLITCWCVYGHVCSFGLMCVCGTNVVRCVSVITITDVCMAVCVALVLCLSLCVAPVIQVHEWSLSLVAVCGFGLMFV